MEGGARSVRQEVSQELPVTLTDGVLRVGSSYALAGVPNFWAPYEPVAEARRGGGAPRAHAAARSRPPALRTR